MSVLVFAEQDGKALRPSTLQAVTAAAAWQLPIDLLVYGDSVESAAAEAAQLAGIRRVLEIGGGCRLGVSYCLDMRLAQWIDLGRSQRIDIGLCLSVCIVLGPTQWIDFDLGLAHRIVLGLA